MPMTQQWIYNPLKDRFELWGNDGAGHVGVIQIAAYPGTTHPDIEPGTPVMPLSDEDYALAQRARTGDTAALQTITAGLAQRNAALRGQTAAPAGGQAQGQGQGYGGVRQTPGQIEAYTNIVNQATDLRSAHDTLAQKEYELRQRMAQAGNDPAYWFGQGQAGTGAAAAGPGDISSMPGVAFDPAYINAYTGQNTAAARAALLARAEQLQQVANAFSAHMEGVDWLDKYRAAGQNIQDMEAAYQWDVNHARGDSGGLQSARMQLERAQREQQRMAQTRFPGMAQPPAAPVPTPTPVPVAPPVPAPGAPAPVDWTRTQTYAGGGQVPAYAGGGATDWGASGWGGSGGTAQQQSASGYENTTPYGEAPPGSYPAPKVSDMMPEHPGNIEGGNYQYGPQFEVAKSQATQRAFAAEMQRLAQQRDAEIGRIAQAAAARLQQMQVAHTQALHQIQSGVPQVEQDVARRRAGLTPQRTLLAGQQMVRPFANPGPVATAW